MDHIFFIQSSADQYLGCLHTLAVVNNAAMMYLSKLGFHVLFKIHTQEWSCWFIRYFCFQFFQKPPYCFIREGNGTSLQYSCLENPMDGGAWWAAVHGVTKSRTGLSDFTFTFHFHALKKEMATHSNVLAWRIPGMGEPHGLPSMESHRVRHN